MNNDNIPEGYDENGTRNGNGNWVMDDEDTRQGTVDGYDFYRDIEMTHGGYFVECAKCGKMVLAKNTIKTHYGTGFLCEKCMKEFDI